MFIEQYQFCQNTLTPIGWPQLTVPIKYSLHDVPDSRSVAIVPTSTIANFIEIFSLLLLGIHK